MLVGYRCSHILVHQQSPTEETGKPMDMHNVALSTDTIDLTVLSTSSQITAIFKSLS